LFSKSERSLPRSVESALADDASDPGQVPLDPDIDAEGQGYKTFSSFVTDAIEINQGILKGEVSRYH
jgi:hypothetical protein